MDGIFGLVEMLKFLYYNRKIKGIRSLIGSVKKKYCNTGIIAVLYYETKKMLKKENINGVSWDGILRIMTL